jgi:hypothetical protein
VLAHPSTVTLENLTDDVEQTYAELADVDVDEEARRELTMLATAFDADDPAALVERAIHLLFQTSVDTGRLDFHLRSTYVEMAGAPPAPDDDERRYQF